MKHYLCLLIGILLYSTHLQALADEPRMIAFAEFAINTATIGDTKEDIVRKLGVPIEIQKNPNGPAYSYGNVELGVIFNNEKTNLVRSIMARSSKFCTPSKVCPGQHLSVATTIYGKTLTTRDGAYTSAIYDTERKGCRMTIGAHHSIIKVIWIRCDPIL